MIWVVPLAKGICKALVAINEEEKRISQESRSSQTIRMYYMVVFFRFTIRMYYMVVFIRFLRREVHAFMVL